MAVPKKPKKLDRPPEQTAERPPALNHAPKKPGPTAEDPASAEKLDAALEIVEKLGGNEDGDRPAADPAPTGPGFRWRVSLVALMPEEEQEDSGATSLLEMGFTVPFFWDVPFWGEMTRQYVRGLKALKPPKFFF